MTAITDKNAREHRPTSDPIAPQRLVLCSCDDYETSRDAVAHTRHIAQATEFAVWGGIRQAQAPERRGIA